MFLAPAVADLLPDEVFIIGQFLILILAAFPFGDRLFQVFRRLARLGAVHLVVSNYMEQATNIVRMLFVHSPKFPGPQTLFITF